MLFPTAWAIRIYALSFPGARGTGKTALLSLMASEAESQGWITARTTAAEGMLEDVLDQALVSAATSSIRWAVASFRAFLSGGSSASNGITKRRAWAIGARR